MGSKYGQHVAVRACSEKKRAGVRHGGVRRHIITERRGGQGGWGGSVHESGGGGAEANGRSARDSGALRNSTDQYISSMKCARAHRDSSNGRGGRAGGAGGAGVVGHDGCDDSCDGDLATSVVRWWCVAHIIVELWCVSQK